MHQEPSDYLQKITDHYHFIWKSDPQIYLWDKGPIDQLPFDFRVLVFPPTELNNLWTYATCGMSSDLAHGAIELHIHSLKEDDGLIELLTTLAYYHHHTARIDLHHTVNFGRPWQDNSACAFGFISLPYLHGPALEHLILPEANCSVKCYWLIPVTEQEMQYKIQYGATIFEEKLDEIGTGYANPIRASLV